jgi:hypothetical protein
MREAHPDHGSSQSPWPCQEVPNPSSREDDLWVARVGFEFGPETPDVDPQAVHRSGVVITPYVFSKSRVGCYQPGVSHEVVDDLRLDRREIDLLLAMHKLARGRVEAKVADRQRKFICEAALVANPGLYPRQQLQLPARFYDEVVGSPFLTLDNVGLVVPGREDDDRH